MKILRKCGIILFLILLFSLCFSLKVEGYTFTVDGNSFTELRGSGTSLENHLSGTNRTVKTISVTDMNADGSTVDLGNIYGISLGGVVIYSDKQEELSKFTNSSYDNHYVAISPDKLRKISAISGTDDVPLDTIIDAKLTNLIKAFDDYMQGDMSTKMEISQDLGIASATAGSDTGLRWWGMNYSDIINSNYYSSTLYTSQEVYITSDVPAISGGSAYGGGTKYYIIVPNAFASIGGVSQVVNEEQIKNIARFVTGETQDQKNYKLGVKQALVKATIEYGYNVTTFKADTPTKVSGIVDKTTNTIKAGSGVKYAFSYFMHPGFGKMDTNVPKTEDGWLANDGSVMLRLVNITSGGQKIWPDRELGMMEALTSGANGTGALYFVPSQEFIAFRKAVTGGSSYYAEAKANENDKSNCVVPIRAGVSNNIKTYVDCCVPVTAPALYEVGSSGGYTLATSMPGLLMFKGISYNLLTETVYQGEGSERKAMATVAGMHASTDDIYLYNAEFNDSTAMGHVNQPNSSGCVVFLTFYEALVNPDGTENSSKLLTGRVVRLKSSVLTNIDLTTKKHAMIKGINSGTEKETSLQAYAFANNLGSMYSVEAHDIVPKSSSIRFHYDVWSNSSSSGVSNFGIRIFRNNKYVSNDTELLNWVQGDAIKNISFTDPDTLLDWIQGKLKPAEQLSYTEWKYLQEVKEFLEDDKVQGSKKFFTVPVVIFGIFIIIYGILIALAYLIDIFNNFFDFSILYFLTFKKVFPVASKTELEYINKKDGVKYVTFRWVYMTFSLCVIIGFLFVNYVWILGIFSSIFYTVREFMNNVF